MYASSSSSSSIYKDQRTIYKEILRMKTEKERVKEKASHLKPGETNRQ